MTAIFPGSFDPVTLGHVDLIMRGTRLFGTVIVAVLHNPAKTPLLTLQERVCLLQKEVRDIPGVQVESYAGLLAEFASAKNAGYILRGVRSEADCAYEIPMAQANRKLSAGTEAGLKAKSEAKPETGLETILLVADPAYGYISSGMIREIAAAGYQNSTKQNGFDDKALDQWVSPAVKEVLKNKYTSS